MIDWAKKNFRSSWFACARFAELESRKIDGPISLSDRLAHKFHYFLCYTCRQVAKHWGQLDQDLKHSCSDNGPLKSEKLSPEKLKAIQQLVRRDLNG